MKTYKITLLHRHNIQWEDKFPWVITIDDDGKIIYFAREIEDFNRVNVDGTLDSGINLKSGDDYWTGITWYQTTSGAHGGVVEYKWKNPLDGVETAGDSVELSFYWSSLVPVDSNARATRVPPTAWRLNNSNERREALPTGQSTLKDYLVIGENDNPPELVIKVTVGSNEIEVLSELPTDRWEVLIEEIGRPTASPYVDTEDIMFWLKGTNSRLEVTDPIPEAKVASDKIIPFLASKIDTSKWTNKANTPDIVCNCIAQLAAAYRYNVYNTETTADGGTSYTRKLERDVWACLDDIREGFINIGVEVDKYSFTKSTPAFTMEMTF